MLGTSYAARRSSSGHVAEENPESLADALVDFLAQDPMGRPA